MTSPSRKTVILTGLALIVLPIAALVLKGAVYPGWMMLIIIWSGLPLLIGYVLQVVIAAVAMFRRRGVFNRMPGARRGVVAAWVTSLGVLLSAFFLVDGGDDGVYGSAFTALLGMSSTPEGEALSMAFLTVFAVIWIAAWFWLVIEWIALSARAKREGRSLRTDRTP